MRSPYVNGKGIRSKWRCLDCRKRKDVNLMACRTRCLACQRVKDAAYQIEYKRFVRELEETRWRRWENDVQSE